MTTENINNNIPDNVIDLTKNKDLTEYYWLLSKRDYPKYPIRAAKLRINGCVEFSFIISDSGKAQNIKVIKSVPDNIFDKSALKSLKKYSWAPSENNFDSTPVLTTLQLEFRTHPIKLAEKCTVS